MNVIRNLLAVAVAGIVLLVRTFIMIVANIGVLIMAVAVGACRAEFNGYGMIDAIR